MLDHARIGDTRLIVNGGGDVSADRIDGRVDAQTTGSGDIRIASVSADSMRLSGEGSGDIIVEGGRIGALTAERGGSGDLVVQASIDGGTLSHHGSGDVTLPHVSGTLIRTESKE
jgi:hypothetical protein